MQTEFVGFRGVPGQIEATRAVFLRADAVFPAIAGNEVAARVADRSRTQLANKIQHIAAESVLVGGRMARLVDARVHTAAQMLHEGAEQSVVHRGHNRIIIDNKSRLRHCITFQSWNYMDAFKRTSYGIQRCKSVFVRIRRSRNP